MRQRHKPRNKRFTALASSIMIATALLLYAVVPFATAAGGLTDRFDRISTPLASATATHLIGFTPTDTVNPLGSILIEFCSDGPLVGTPCTPPTGMDATGVNLAAQTGEVGFTVHPSSMATTILLSRVPAVPGANPSTYRLDNIVNPDTAGSHYVRLQTFSTDDGTGTSLEDGGLVFAIVPDVGVTTEVPPYLNFCAGVVITALDCSSATTYFVDLGEFSTTQTALGTSEFVVSTNAPNGFTIAISGNTLTSGNNTIPALNVPTAPVVGTSQFGINLRSNPSQGVGADPSGPGVSVPTVTYNTPGLYSFQNGDSLVTSTTTSDFRKFTVTYMTNIGINQPPGIYNSTFSYICLANF